MYSLPWTMQVNNFTQIRSIYTQCQPAREWTSPTVLFLLIGFVVGWQLVVLAGTVRNQFTGDFRRLFMSTPAAACKCQYRVILVQFQRRVCQNVALDSRHAPTAIVLQRESKWFNHTGSFFLLYMPCSVRLYDLNNFFSIGIMCQIFKMYWFHRNKNIYSIFFVQLTKRKKICLDPQYCIYIPTQFHCFLKNSCDSKILCLDFVARSVWMLGGALQPIQTMSQFIGSRSLTCQNDFLSQNCLLE